MLVRAYKLVEVECEVEIGMDEILAEFADRKNEASETYWRRLAPVLDCITKILAAVPDDLLTAIPVNGRQILASRLSAQAQRFQTAKTC